MASLSNDPGGRRRIQFVDADGNRKTIRLGKMSKRQAEAVKLRVEDLVAAKLSNGSPSDETSRWLATVDDSLLSKLAKHGLAAARGSEKLEQLGTFLSAWQESRQSDYKPASLRAWKQVIDALVKFYGVDLAMKNLTQEKAEEFRQSMIAKGLRATTIHKRLQHARMFFDHARRQGIIDTNPFEFVRHRPGDASERRAYVPAEDILRVIEFAPNDTWKLLIGLSRFAGLRVPSEALSLRWQDVDWERNRVTVPSPKTQHLPGRSYRVIPLFPAIRPYLEAAWDQAPEGAEYVVPEEYRKRAQGPNGWANANLRTTFAKIVRRAGLETWPRLWHSMRASCETDLAREFPLPVVAKWLGNTQAVAMRHYVDVTDADFERAAATDTASSPRTSQKGAQSVHVPGRSESQSESGPSKKPLKKQGSATSCKPLLLPYVEAAGIEPVTAPISCSVSASDRTGSRESEALPSKVFLPFVPAALGVVSVSVDDSSGLFE